MSNVDDHGLEVIKKAAEFVDPTSETKKKDYYLKVGIFGQLQAPVHADAGTVEYPTNTQEVYKFRQGGIAGTVLKTITINYTNASKDFILNWAVT